MSRSEFVNRRGSIASAVLLLAVLGTGGGLAVWKYSSIKEADAAAANQPEPTEMVTTAIPHEIDHRQTSTSIGTVLALRSIDLQNELAGTVHQVRLTPGQVVEAGSVLLKLDTSVEEAELEAQQAQVNLAKTTLNRLKNLREHLATSQEEVDQAQAEHDVALAQIARIKAVIAKKIIRAPFRARIGLSDVHPGQYLNEGTHLTTLQSVDDAAHVDFTAAQRVAAGLRVGDRVEVFVTGDTAPRAAQIVAIDARVDTTTRNALVRARVKRPGDSLAPGASVRVRVPSGPPGKALVVPVNALRKGPGGDHVFVIAEDKEGKTRAQQRPVRSGPVLGDSVLIYSGISAGERVATSGSFKLREGVLVAVASDSTKGPSSAAGASDSSSVSGQGGK
jgi:membrane fusion protein (multidrug efflux system)